MAAGTSRFFLQRCQQVFQDAASCLSDFTRRYKELYAPRTEDGLALAQHLQHLGIDARLPELPLFLQLIWQNYWQAKQVTQRVTATSLAALHGILPLPCLATLQLFAVIETIWHEDNHAGNE